MADLEVGAAVRDGVVVVHHVVVLRRAEQRAEHADADVGVGRASGCSDAQWMPTAAAMPGAKPRDVFAPAAPMSILSGIMNRGPGRRR